LKIENATLNEHLEYPFDGQLEIKEKNAKSLFIFVETYIDIVQVHIQKINIQKQ